MSRVACKAQGVTGRRECSPLLMDPCRLHIVSCDAQLHAACHQLVEGMYDDLTSGVLVLAVSHFGSSAIVAA
eukprot:3408968-Amphidinium_carterae.1